MTKYIISYSQKKNGKFLERELLEYVNDGNSERDGDAVTWTVELPEDVIERLVAANRKGVSVKAAA